MNFHYESAKEYLSYEIGHRLIQQDKSDRYIVSYPRSGNTWLRTILTYLIVPDCESLPDAREDLIPGVSIRNSARVNRLAPPRLIKSHSWYQSRIPNAVYLVRDGRDAVISLYHYRITRQGINNITFPDFFQRYLAGHYGHLWHNNVESWLIQGRESLGDKLLIVKFEDLKSNTPQEMSKIVDFLNLDANESEILKAIESSKLDKMRLIEQSRRGEIANPDQSFYRGGKTGQWKDYFTPAIEAQFYGSAARALTMAGYDLG